MIWKIKDKEHTIKTCFAFFPKKIGDYRVWLQRYYKTWDFVSYSGYVPHWFIHKGVAEDYVRKKMANHE
jgi:hypothetical protein